jgi:hypothetical protein
MLEKDAVELIKAYVPEAEFFWFYAALDMAIERDNRAADAFVASYEACQS